MIIGRAGRTACLSGWKDAEEALRLGEQPDGGGGAIAYQGSVAISQGDVTKEHRPLLVERLRQWSANKA